MQHSKTGRKMPTPVERSEGPLFLCSSSSRTQPGYLMLHWRVRQHCYLPSITSYLSIISLFPITSSSQGLVIYFIVVSFFAIEAAGTCIRKFVGLWQMKPLQLVLFHIGISFPLRFAIWRWKQWRTCASLSEERGILGIGGLLSNRSMTPCSLWEIQEVQGKHQSRFWNSATDCSPALTQIMSDLTKVSRGLYIFD